MGRARGGAERARACLWLTSVVSAGGAGALPCALSGSLTAGQNARLRAGSTHLRPPERWAGRTRTWRIQRCWRLGAAPPPRRCSRPGSAGRTVAEPLRRGSRAGKRQAAGGSWAGSAAAAAPARRRSPPAGSGSPAAASARGGRHRGRGFRRGRLQPWRVAATARACSSGATPAGR